MKKSFKKRYLVPIYDADFWLIISDDIYDERAKMSDLFGDPPSPTYWGLCSSNGRGDVAVFLKRSRITSRLVAHELFHATHRILQWIGWEFSPNNHEPAALLNGYLSDLVSQAIAADKKRK